MATIISKIEDLVFHEVREVATYNSFMALKLSNVMDDRKYLFLRAKKTIQWEEGPDKGPEFPIETILFETVIDVKEIPSDIIKKMNLKLGIE
jgi:hypothetical protein